MALTKVTGQVIKNTTDVTVGVLTVTNTLAVGGTVSIGGTLTYEDVTNVDAVGLITARNGIVVGSGITLSKDGDVFFTGIATGNGSGLTNLPAANLTGTLPAISGANLTNLDASDLASGTVPTARLGSGTASSSTFLRGDSTFAVVTSTTINNNADNRLITGSGTADTLNGEADLTFDGTSIFEVQPSSATPARLIGDSNRTGSGQHLAQFEGNWNGTGVGRMVVVTGDDTTNKDDGHLDFFTTPSGGTSTRRLRITSTGKINIGDTQTSQNILNIEDGTAASMEFASHGTGGDTAYIGVKKSAGNGLTFGISNRDIIFKTGATYSSGTVFDSGTEKVRITSGGQLFVGGNTGWNESASLLSIATDAAAGADMLSDSSAIYNHTNPAFVHVQNRYNTGSEQESGIILHSKSSYNASWAIYNKRTANYVGDLIFRNRTGASSSAERLRITSGGQVLIGATSNNSVNARLAIVTDGVPSYYANPSALSITSSNSADANAVEIFQGRYNKQCMTLSHNYNSSMTFAVLEQADVTVGSITGNGSNASFNTSSDYRLKENIVNITDGITRLKQLTPRRFNWIADSTNTLEDGFIAHEVSPIIPEAVTGEKDAQEEDGSIDPQQMDYSKLVPLLTAALQESITKIETLETELSALKSQLNN